jgi:hypothetical protein
MSVALAAVLACTGDRDAPDATDRTDLVRALEMLPGDPDGARRRCAAISDVALRSDCLLAAAEAAPERAHAEGWCAELPGGDAADECSFQLAERLGHVELCDASGAFRDDCRLHLFRDSLPRWFPRGVPLADAVATARSEMTRRGYDPDAEQYWIAVFAHYHHHALPGDPEACASLDERLIHACNEGRREVERTRGHGHPR